MPDHWSGDEWRWTLESDGVSGSGYAHGLQMTTEQIKQAQKRERQRAKRPIGFAPPAKRSKRRA